MLIEQNEGTYNTHRDILIAVLKVVSPENTGYLWSALQATRAVNNELGAEGIMLPSQRLYLEAIAETYKNASSWDTLRQILSIMTATASFSTIREFIPGLSQCNSTHVPRFHFVEFYVFPFFTAFTSQSFSASYHVTLA